MTPELIKMKELMLKTYLDEHGCEYFNLSTDLDQYATAYLDEAIRKCVPEQQYIGEAEHCFKIRLLQNVERFKKGEL